MRENVKVLFLSADPGKKNALRTDRELAGILNAVRGAPGEVLEVVSELAVKAGDLQAAILRHDPQIIHFAGHGYSGTGLMMDDRTVVGSAALVDLIAALEGSVRAVVLNACHTELVAEALSRVVDYAVGMGEPIGDKAAIAFSTAFYSALAFGRSIPAAFKLGRNQVDLHTLANGGVPSLRVRLGHHPDPLVPRASAIETRTEPTAAAVASPPQRGQRLKIG